MSYPLEKYRIFEYKNPITKSTTIAAVSSYAGRTVKAYAKLNPEDEYDYEFGKKLACLRCAQKVEKKRLKRANLKYAEAMDEVVAATKHFSKMSHYLADSKDELMRITNELEKLT